MAIRFFFAHEAKGLLQLPVNPSEIKISKSNDIKNVTTLGLGEISLINIGKLGTIEFEGFFPANPDRPYVVTTGQFQPPQHYIDFFEWNLNDRFNVRFIVSDTKINGLYTVERFDWSIVAGTEDVKYSIELKEYRVFTAKTVKITAPPKKEEGEKKKITPPPKVTRPKTGFAIGDAVTANGSYWESSYGKGKHGTFNNFSGKISHIVADTTRKYRYHITDPNGGFKGWVNESQIAHRS